MPGRVGYRLLITDLDGTLLDATSSVSQVDRRAIAALQSKGVIVSIATGRMYSGTRAIARVIGVTGPVACIDGSHIVNAATDADLVCHSIEAPALARVGQVLEQAGAATVVFSRDVIYYDQSSHPYLPFLTVWSDRVEEVGRVLADARWATGSPVTAAVGIAPKQEIVNARAVIERDLGSAVQVITFGVRGDETWGMVVRATGVSKGTALEWIARRHGVPIAETIAVGDWINDIPMLRTAGRSFCMAQAPAEVAAAATETLTADGWSGGGIAEAAERAGLL